MVYGPNGLAGEIVPSRAAAESDIAAGTVTTPYRRHPDTRVSETQKRPTRVEPYSVEPKRVSLL